MWIISAKYIDGYKIAILFEDGKTIVANFEKFLHESKNPMISKFKDMRLFKKFRIDFGAISWGDNEFDISPESIYEGEFSY